ncbi:MAG TPA: PspC domain-containing protein [Candidatus Avibacteroides faecavium]|nr:PspC domain-containing protein [Candidatus Avibacteroides faecavium]
MNNRRLTRSSNRMIGGVCSGLAEYLGWDPTAVRVAWVLLTFFTVFSGVVVYLIFWLIMPED